MGFIRAAIWTALCVGLGIFVSTYDVGGRTPLEIIQREWKSSEAPTKLDQIVVDAKSKIAEPVEKISKADRDSLNSLIAKKSPPATKTPSN